jgi:hypothetical protein
MNFKRVAAFFAFCLPGESAAPECKTLSLKYFLVQVWGLLNPILPGWNPDPSILRVGSDYFIATSTFEYFPGHPIYHSTGKCKLSHPSTQLHSVISLDLVSWKLIGHGLNRPSQLSFFGTPSDAGTQFRIIFLSATGKSRGIGIWAPSLRYHAPTKTYYLASTARYAYTGKFSGRSSVPTLTSTGSRVSSIPEVFLRDDQRHLRRQLERPYLFRYFWLTFSVYSTLITPIRRARLRY